MATYDQPPPQPTATSSFHSAQGGLRDALTQDSYSALDATQRYNYGLTAALRRGTNRGTSRRITPARRVPSVQ
jgi:hypothetical protein